MRACPRKVIYANIYGAIYAFVPIKDRPKHLMCFHRDGDKWVTLCEYGRANLDDLFAHAHQWKKLEGPPTGVPRYVALS